MKLSTCHELTSKDVIEHYKEDVVVEKEACISTCHELTSKYEVENYKEYIVVGMEDLIMKKEMKKRKN